MPTDFLENEPQNIWQQQPTEAFTMSLEQLHRKAEQHERAARSTVLKATVIGLILCGWFAWGVTQVHELVSRIGLVILSLWSLYYPVHGYRWMWPSLRLREADAGTTVRRYRAELERQRNCLRDIWVNGGLVVCFVGVVLFVMPSLIQTARNPRLLLNLAPLLALAALWLAIFIPRRRRSLRKMQLEIEQLRALENHLG